MRVAQIINDYAIPLTTMQLEPCEKLEGSHSQNRFHETAPDWSVCSWGVTAFSQQVSLGDFLLVYIAHDVTKTSLF
jgi:hypothetical protein